MLFGLAGIGPFMRQENDTVLSRFWETLPRNDHVETVREVYRFLMKRIDRLNDPILRSRLSQLFLNKDRHKSKRCLIDNARRRRPHIRLHPALRFDLDKDIMFDEGDFFDKISDMGIKRLFYTGQVLDMCVIHTRQFSSLEAALSNRFLSVRVITDMTVPSDLLRTFVYDNPVDLPFDFESQNKTVNMFSFLQPKLDFIHSSSFTQQP